MFLRHFILNGFLSAVGSMPDYWIILNAAGYMEKGVLTLADLEEIQAAIDACNGAQPSDANEGQGGEPDGGEPGNEPDGGEPGNETDSGEPGNEPDGGEPGNEPDGGEPGNEPDGGEPGNEPDGGELGNAEGEDPPTAGNETGGEGE